MLNPSTLERSDLVSGRAAADSVVKGISSGIDATCSQMTIMQTGQKQHGKERQWYPVTER